MKIKVCGITNTADAHACERNGADALGFVFYNKSKRYIAPENAAEICKALSAFTTTVGVFVHTPVNEVNRIMKQAKLHVAQIIAGDLTPYHEQCEYPFYHCVRIDDDFNFACITIDNGRNILLDTYSKSAYGGTGTKFNWSKIPMQIRHAVILAGGIGEGDLKTIKQTINPYGVDVSSSLEISPGVKDLVKIEQFFKTVNAIR
ncbi:MAG: phosphoribosylanthranilate isomerase [Ignavibacteriales bacterium]|nr:phosphoribosylanthranilate isomerase [Ignavibacteriales bacterium]